MLCDNADAVTPVSAAACVKLPWRATHANATNAGNWAGSIAIPIIKSDFTILADEQHFSK
ncbi:hypothetical protein GCM10011400_01120 [Paraburkholderia caffeinilytica]|uniref:Uncharacterized protein n=1 Tax=Paraburkholderia caffeinilytica TaxID=1761016 RepID=A0ABQ1L7Y4_9BURK|nr:hypothetical protein GCM10011400_01120 [Paraburkholderia caffeinilytica]